MEDKKYSKEDVEAILKGFVSMVWLLAIGFFAGIIVGYLIP